VTELQKILRTYKNAKKAFDACPDTVRSDPVPPESQRIINFYFAVRERLFQVASASSNRVALEWAQAFTAAEDCPELVNTGKSDEAAHRMEVFGAAEIALLEIDTDGQQEEMR
jgi:hypothetical protein